MSYIPFICLGQLDQGGLDKAQDGSQAMAKMDLYLLHLPYQLQSRWQHLCLLVQFHGHVAIISSGFFWQVFTILGDLLEEVWDLPPPKALWHYPKDPIPPWGTLDMFTDICESLVKDLTLKLVPCIETSLLLSRVVRWQPHVVGITLMEFFGGISTKPIAMLEAILHNTCHIYIDSNVVSLKATWHHIQQWLAQYPNQLVSSVVSTCFTLLP